MCSAFTVKLTLVFVDVYAHDWWWWLMMTCHRAGSHRYPVTSASEKRKKRNPTINKIKQWPTQQSRTTFTVPNSPFSFCLCVVLSAIWQQSESGNWISSLFWHGSEKITPSDSQTREHVDSTLSINSRSCWLACHLGGNSACAASNQPVITRNVSLSFRERLK